jgi:hypothetical protein
VLKDTVNNPQRTKGSWSTTRDNHTNYGSAMFFGEGLMLPAAGYRTDYLSGELHFRGRYGSYWSSSADDDYNSLYLTFRNEDAGVYHFDRRAGLSVRCISDDSSQPQTLSLGKTTSFLDSGASETVTIIGGSGNYSASSSNSQVATAVISGNNLEITALSSGTATIIVEDTAGESASIDVTVKTSDTEIIITSTDISPAEVPATARDITLSCYVYAPNGIGHIKSVDFIGKWPAIETGWQLKYQGMDGDSALYTTQIAPMAGSSYPYSIPIEFIVTGVDNSTKTANNSLLVWGP